MTWTRKARAEGSESHRLGSKGTKAGLVETRIPERDEDVRS